MKRKSHRTRGKNDWSGSCRKKRSRFAHRFATSPVIKYYITLLKTFLKLHPTAPLCAKITRRLRDDRYTRYYYALLSEDLIRPQCSRDVVSLNEKKRKNNREKWNLREATAKRPGPMYHKSPTKRGSYTTRESECGFFRFFISPVLSPPSTPPRRRFAAGFLFFHGRICYVSAAKDSRLAE